VSGSSIVLGFLTDWAPEAILRAVSSFSFLSHFSAIVRGVIDLRDAVFRPSEHSQPIERHVRLGGGIGIAGPKGEPCCFHILRHRYHRCPATPGTHHYADRLRDPFGLPGRGALS